MKKRQILFILPLLTVLACSNPETDNGQKQSNPVNNTDVDNTDRQEGTDTDSDITDNTDGTDNDNTDGTDHDNTDNTDHDNTDQPVLPKLGEACADGVCGENLVCVTSATDTVGVCQKSCNNDDDCTGSCMQCDKSVNACLPAAAGSKPAGCNGANQQCGDNGSCVCTGNFAGDNCTQCKEGWTGTNCDDCDDTHFGPTCEPCLCQHSGFSKPYTCNHGINGDGHCLDASCEIGWDGIDCDRCDIAFFGKECAPCNCGSDKFCNEGIEGSGSCFTCAAGRYGANCDKCEYGYYGPNCQKCENGYGLECTPYGTLFVDSQHSYRTVKVGSQTWMAQNMDVKTEKGSWSYAGGVEEEAANYGLLYTYDAAEKLCPDDWHLPTKSDWQTLVDYVENNRTGYNLYWAMISKPWVYDKIENCDARTLESSPALCNAIPASGDEFGLNITLAGNGSANYSGFEYYQFEEKAVFWTSDYIDPGEMYTLVLENHEAYYFFGTSYKHRMHSVRCVKNSTAK